MANTFSAGQKIWFRDIFKGMHKAVIISVRETVWYGGIPGLKHATIKITSKGDRVFYRGYTFETTQTRLFARD